MPPVGKLAGLTAEEKLDFQRDRNRRKSAALRARKKEASSKEKTEEAHEGNSSSSLTGQGGAARAGLVEQGSREDEKDAVIRRLVARLAELGEAEEQINMLLAGEARMEASSSDGLPPSGPSPTSLKLETDLASWDMNEDVSSGPSFELPTAVHTSQPEQLSSVTLFGSLMNDSTSLPPLTSQPGLHLSQLSHLSFPTLNVDKIRLALSLSAAYPHVLPQHLPSYSYSSFASSLNNYPSWIRSEDDTLEWKWRLFEFHRVSHDNRHHPTEGYITNPEIDALVASAQLLILKLAASTSTLDRKAIFDARRPLQNQADQDYLKLPRIDPRIQYIPGPRARLRTSQLTSGGPPNYMSLTEQIGQGFAISWIHGDYWDLTSWNGPDSSPLPLSLSQDSFITDLDLQAPNNPLRGRGALIREIVLGLEQPGWRVPPPPAYLPSPFEEACVREEPPIWTHWEEDHRVRTMEVH